MKKALRNLKVIGLDTNVFIYYFEGHARFGPSSKAIFGALILNKVAAVTSIISVIETLSKKTLPDKVAKEIYKNFFEIPNVKILDVNSAIGVEAARIRRRYGFRLPDAIGLATAIEGRARAFVTNDDRLKPFKELPLLLLHDL